MTLSARLSSIVALAAALTGSVGAHAATDIAWFQPQYPAVFAPTNGFSQEVLVRAYSVFGWPNAWDAEVRIDVTCGDFLSGGTSMLTVVVADSWVSDQGAWLPRPDAVSRTYLYTSTSNPVVTPRPVALPANMQCASSSLSLP